MSKIGDCDVFTYFGCTSPAPSASPGSSAAAEAGDAAAIVADREHQPVAEAVVRAAVALDGEARR